MVGSYVYDTFEVDADALAMATTPLDELLRLRTHMHVHTDVPDSLACA